jgi:hypothetical protein
VGATASWHRSLTGGFFPSGANSCDAQCKCVCSLLEVWHMLNMQITKVDRRVERASDHLPHWRKTPPPRWALAARGALFLCVGVCALIDLSARDRKCWILCVYGCVRLRADTETVVCNTVGDKCFMFPPRRRMSKYDKLAFWHINQPKRVPGKRLLL